MNPETFLAWKSLYLSVFLCSCICAAVAAIVVATQLASGEYPRLVAQFNTVDRRPRRIPASRLPTC